MGEIQLITPQFSDFTQLTEAKGRREHRTWNKRNKNKPKAEQGNKNNRRRKKRRENEKAKLVVWIERKLKRHR